MKKAGIRAVFSATPVPITIGNSLFLWFFPTGTRTAQ
jgi:hypothetical protein